MQDRLYHGLESDVESGLYVPTDEEAAEMMEMYRCDPDQEEFDEWLLNLPDRDLVDMRRAIDTIRRILKDTNHALPMPVLAGWIDL